MTAAGCSISILAWDDRGRRLGKTCDETIRYDNEDEARKDFYLLALTRLNPGTNANIRLKRGGVVLGTSLSIGGEDMRVVSVSPVSGMVHIVSEATAAAAKEQMDLWAGVYESCMEARP